MKPNTKVFKLLSKLFIILQMLHNVADIVSSIIYLSKK